MSSAAPTARPGSVTTVMVLTWIVALFSIIGGVALLLASDSTLDSAGIAASTATTAGWVEIVLGIVIALVAIGLGSGSGLSRMLVTILMVIRLGVAVWAAIAFRSQVGFWSILLSAAIAALVLFLLWNSKASEFFRTN